MPAARAPSPMWQSSQLEALKHSAEDATFIVQCSYLEVYNDRLNDLLGRQSDLKMRELGGGKGITVEGLTHEVVTTVEEVMSALRRGQARRTAAATRHAAAARPLRARRPPPRAVPRAGSAHRRADGNEPALVARARHLHDLPEGDDGLGP